MSNFFMNDRKSLINDVIEGAILTTPYKNLARLDVDSAIRVVQATSPHTLGLSARVC
jgi:dihydroxyacetone kinase